MAWTVRRGTDKQFPSVRVAIDGYTPGDQITDKREIALVFRKGESVKEAQQAIEDAVNQYLEDHPRGASATPFISPDILNLTGPE